MPIFYLILFFLGSAFGSFLNVLSLRYEPGTRVLSKKSVQGRSKCLKCRRNLKWFELIPIVSFLVLRRKCRTCKAEILWQYPAVEFLSGLIFVLTPFYFAKFYNIGNFFYFRPELWSFYFYAAFWIFALLTMLLIAVIDFRHYLIPDELNLLAGFLGVAVFAAKFFAADWLLALNSFFLKNYTLLFSPFKGILANHIFGALTAGLFFWFMVFVSKGKAMGFGDVKLMFALGLLFGWPDIFLTIIFSFIIGSVWGLVLIFFYGKDLKAKMPFAPSIALASAVTIFLGHSIVGWYFGLFLG